MSEYYYHPHCCLPVTVERQKELMLHLAKDKHLSMILLPFGLSWPLHFNKLILSWENLHLVLHSNIQPRSPIKPRGSMQTIYTLNQHRTTHTTFLNPIRSTHFTSKSQPMSFIHLESGFQPMTTYPYVCDKLLWIHTN